jgi:hypothetical protein
MPVAIGLPPCLRFRRPDPVKEKIVTHNSDFCKQILVAGPLRSGTIEPAGTYRAKCTPRSKPLESSVLSSRPSEVSDLRPRLIDRSVVVFDDHLHSVDGVVGAAREFTAAHPDWAAFPLFPGQGLMINRDWFA